MRDKSKALLAGIIAAILTGFLSSCALFYPAGLYRDAEKYLSSQAVPIIMKVPVVSDYQSGFFNPIIYQNKLYFKGNSQLGTRLYVIGDAGDYSVRAIFISDYTNGFNTPVVFDNLLFFEGTEVSSFYSRIFQYNGSAFTYYLSNNNYSYGFTNSLIFNNTLYFQGIDINYSSRVFSLSGGMISEPVTNGDYRRGFYNPIVYGDELIFRGENTNYVSLAYKIDLYSNVSNFFMTAFTNFVNPILVNGELYFAARDPMAMDTLCRYDGSSIFWPSGADYGYYFDYAKVYNNKLFFAGYNSSYGISDYPFYVIEDAVYAMPVPADFDSGYGDPQIFQGKLYFSYQSTDTNFNTKLGVYDDSTQTAKSMFYMNGVYIFPSYYAYNDTHLFFTGITNTNVSSASDVKIDMYAYLGGSNLIQVSNSSDYVIGMINPFVFNGEIYFGGYDDINATGAMKLYKITFPSEK